MADFGVWQRPGRHVATARIPATVAGTADEFAVFEAALGSVEIKRVAIVWDDAIVGASTNNFAVQVRNRGANGTGTTTVTALKTFSSGVDASALVADEQTLSSTASDLVLTDGDVLTLEKSENGTGMAMPNALVVIEFEPR